MQRDWDKLKEQRKMNQLVCGSVNSLMHKIFEGYIALFFERTNNTICVKSFNL